jgi:DnaJ-domain-containing protein 1
MASEKPRLDYYAALGIPRGAGDGQIKIAYRKLAMKYHPDKTAGDPELEAKFKELTAAYSVLSDPQKRKQYDMMGSAVVDMEPLDLERMNFGTTLVAALFSKLGAPIPTAIPQKTLDTALNLQSRMGVEIVEWNEIYSARIATHDSKFYACVISEEEARCGFRVYVSSPSGSKFKLLVFDGDTGALNAQIDCRNETYGRKGTFAAIHFCPFNALEVEQHPPGYSSGSSGAFPLPGEESECPPVFRRLEMLSESRFSPLRAGRRLFAVQGDNFFQDVKFTVRFSPCRPSLAPRIEAAEEALRQRKAALAALETEYWEARARFERVAERVAAEEGEVDAMLTDRDALYATMSDDPDLEEAIRAAARRAEEARARASERAAAASRKP